MKKLGVLQTDFQNYLITADSCAKQYIAGDSEQFIETRLSIYRDSYQARLLSMMHDDFATLLHYLGEKQFVALCQEYFLQHPSQHFSIRNLGQYFPNFLRNHEMFSRKPEIYEIALCDWHLLDICDVANINPIEISALQQLQQEDWPRITLTAHPSVRVEEFQFAVEEVVSRAQENEKRRPAKKYKREKHYLFSRRNMISTFEVVSVAHYEFMKGVFAEKNFSEICESLLQHVDTEKVPEIALSIMISAINDGLFTALSINPDQ